MSNWEHGSDALVLIGLDRRTLVRPSDISAIQIDPWDDDRTQIVLRSGQHVILRDTFENVTKRLQEAVDDHA